MQNDTFDPRLQPHDTDWLLVTVVKLWAHKQGISSFRNETSSLGEWKIVNPVPITYMLVNKEMNQIDNTKAPIAV